MRGSLSEKDKRKKTDICSSLGCNLVFGNRI